MESNFICSIENELNLHEADKALLCFEAFYQAHLCHFWIRDFISFAAVWGRREDSLNACDLQLIAF